jgi:uncharacterized protein with HEPN domain
MFSEEDRAREWVLDIIDNADRVGTHLAGVEFNEFERSLLLQDAIERCLERVSEAAVRLGEERLAAIAPDVKLHQIRGFGNALRHDYGRVDVRTVWDTATHDLPALRAACVAAVGGED